MCRPFPLPWPIFLALKFDLVIASAGLTNTGASQIVNSVGASNRPAFVAHPFSIRQFDAVVLVAAPSVVFLGMENLMILQTLTVRAIPNQVISNTTQVYRRRSTCLLECD